MIQEIKSIEGISGRQGLKIILLAASKAIGTVPYRLVNRGNEASKPDARKVYSYIALLLGYTTTAVADLIQRDHSTIVYHRKTVTDRVEVKDKQIINLINETLKHLKYEHRIKN